MRFDGHLFDSGSRLGFIQANLAYAMADAEIGDGVRETVREIMNGI